MSPQFQPQVTVQPRRPLAPQKPPPPTLANVQGAAGKAKTWRDRAAVLRGLLTFFTAEMPARAPRYTTVFVGAKGNASPGGDTGGWSRFELQDGLHKRVRVAVLSGDAVEVRLADEETVADSERGLPLASTSAPLTWAVDARYLFVSIPNYSAGSRLVVEEEML